MRHYVILKQRLHHCSDLSSLLTTLYKPRLTTNHCHQLYLLHLNRRRITTSSGTAISHQPWTTSSDPRIVVHPHRTRINFLTHFRSSNLPAVALHVDEPSTHLDGISSADAPRMWKAGFRRATSANMYARLPPTDRIHMLLLSITTFFSAHWTLTLMTACVQPLTCYLASPGLHSPSTLGRFLALYL
jgi:hypothetical protein